ncbi:GGDEF domain-containing protein [Longimycelium tulufanense]|uniref:GGDEF domain-containing protein n=1 Tax=Longimycelium tulufanense TaxID=907463 RepID=UPI001666C709|nr:GGDEF domain-containing protein [Longimycelium tulufanense]
MSAIAVDRLTGLLDRWGWDDTAPRALAEARRRGGATALLLIDLDRFKQVNDEFGHIAGDSVLVRAADVIRSAVPETSPVSRYGSHTGDEFVVLLIDVSRSESLGVAEKIRSGIRQAETLVRSPQGIMTVSNVTASIGVALDRRVAISSLSDLVLHADSALRAAKIRGGDQVQLAISKFPTNEKTTDPGDSTWPLYNDQARLGP